MNDKLIERLQDKEYVEKNAFLCSTVAANEIKRLRSKLDVQHMTPEKLLEASDKFRISHLPPDKWFVVDGLGMSYDNGVFINYISKHDTHEAARLGRAKAMIDWCNK